MTKMVIGLLGSPVSEGNTAQLLDMALKGASDAGCTVEKISVNSLDFQGCMEMMFCRDHETCIIDDDMQQMYQNFREMDGIIIATPVMTMGIPGRLKSFMDRFQVFFMAKYVRNKPFFNKKRQMERKGLFICISGMDIPEVFVGAKMTVRAFFDIIDCQYHDELLISDMDSIREIKTQPDLLDAAYKKGYLLGKTFDAAPHKPTE
ncbi:MAG: flavodoxin family protein [Methanoregula sp.]